MSSVETIDDLRTSHCEGYTVACYADQDQLIVTGGVDGEVRVYPGVYEDELASVKCCERVTALAANQSHVAIGNEANEVKLFTLPEVTLDRLLLRFTGAVHYIAITSTDGGKVAACSSDFTVKVISVDGSDQRTLSGHEAPVLSCAFNQSANQIASMSCDGSVRVWNLADQKCVRTFATGMKSNTVENFKGFGHLAWSGEKLACPNDLSIKLINTSTWAEETISTEHESEVSIVSWSRGESYLISATTKGEIFVWNATSKKYSKKYQHHESRGITSMICKNAELLFADDEGQFGVLDLPENSNSTNTSIKASQNSVEMNDSEDDDLLLGTARNKQKKRSHSEQQDEGGDLDMGSDEDGDEFSSAKKRSRVNNMDNFLDDQADEVDEDDDDPNISLNLLKEGLLPKEANPHMPIINEDDDSMSSFVVDDKKTKEKSSKPKVVAAESFMQKPFQPGATPEHLMHRYMVWNDIGMIRCHTEEEGISSVDIEFHDSTTHHAMRVANVLGNHIAALSETAALLACHAEGDMPSKLTCMHFGTWDSNREWILPMPTGENIMAMAVNSHSIVLATSDNFLRILSVGGVQMQLCSTPGPVVSMAMHERQLMVVYHGASGVRKSQCLFVQLMEYKRGSWSNVHDAPLPISTDSSLQWIGFTLEGSPATVDSSSCVRLMQRSANVWLPIANLRSTVKNKSDHYWPINIHEQQKRIKCVLCVGAAFPTTLPRPIPTHLPFEIPLIEMQTDKGKMEHDIMFNRLASSNGMYNQKISSTTDFDKDECDTEQAQLLMKLFALACKSDREYRAVEICRLMPSSQSIGLAVRYASSTKKMALAQRLNDLATEKLEEEEAAEEEEEQQEEEDELFDLLRKKEPSEPIRASTKRTESIRVSLNGRKSRAEEEEEEVEAAADEDDYEMDEDDDMGMLEDLPDSAETISEEKPNSKPAKEKPSLLSSQPRNPFALKRTSEPSEEKRGTKYFEKLQKKPEIVKKAGQVKTGDKPAGPKKTSVERPKKTIAFTKKLNVPKKKPAPVKDTENAPKKLEENLENKKMTGFQLYLSENCPNNEDDEAVGEATLAWKNLTKEEKVDWNTRGKSSAATTPAPDERKVLTEQQQLATPPVASVKVDKQVTPTVAAVKVDTTSSKSKLAAFSFNKN